MTVQAKNTATVTDDGDVMFPSIPALAKWTGWPLDTIEKWPTRYPGLGRKGAWSLRSFVRRYSELAKGGPVVTEGAADLRIAKLKAETRKLEADAEGKQLKNQTARGKLIPRDDAQQAANTLCAWLRGWLEGLPDQMEMSFPTETRAENKADFENAVALALKAVSEHRFVSDEQP